MSGKKYLKATGTEKNLLNILLKILNKRKGYEIHH